MNVPLPPAPTEPAGPDCSLLRANAEPDRKVPRVLIFGCGNLLLSDEGFGVHLIRYLEAHYRFPEPVALLDGGTLGILVTHALEEADVVIIVDVVSAEGRAGEIVRYTKPDFRLQRLPVKLSPHQIGVQEMLLVSELRGRCPAQIILLGVIPHHVGPGHELSPTLQPRLPVVADLVLRELRTLGLDGQPTERSRDRLPGTFP